MSRPGPALPPSVRIRFLPLGSAQRPPVRAGLEQRCGVIVVGWRWGAERGEEGLKEGVWEGVGADGGGGGGMGDPGEGLRGVLGGIWERGD